MTEYNFPWSGVTPGQAGPYTADLYSRVSQDLMNNALRANAGVVVGSGDSVNASLDVQQTAVVSTSVRVRTGSAFVGGRWYLTDADIVIPIPNNVSGNPRIDLLVLRSNSATQIITPFLIEGTPAGSPVAPSPVRSGSIYDIILAEIAVADSFPSITNADIDNTVREYHILLPVELGGTSLSAILLGQLMAGDATNSMAAVAAAVDYGGLIGDDAQPTGMNWVSKKPTVLRSNSSGGTAINTTRTLVPFASADWINPDGYITALSSNQFTLEEGAYKVWGFLGAQTQENVEAARVGWWIAKSTSPATAEAQSLMMTTAPDAGGGIPTSIPIPMYQQMIESNGSDLYEVYAQRTAGAGSAQFATGATLDFGTAYTRAINFERLK